MAAQHRNNEKTMEYLRKLAWMCDPVDRSIPGGGGFRRTTDFLGLADVAAFDGLPGALYIQSTSKGGVTSHWNRYREGIAESPRLYIDRLATLLRAGNRFVIWGWYARSEAVKGQKGQRREVRVRGKLWTFRELSFGLVNGEPEIIGDNKDAYWTVMDAGSSGTRLQIHGTPAR